MPLGSPKAKGASGGIHAEIVSYNYLHFFTAVGFLMAMSPAFHADSAW